MRTIWNRYHVLIRDIVERVIATFVMAFIGGLLTLDIAGLKLAGLAGVAAVLSLLKGLVATRVGKITSASLDPVV